MGFVFSQLNLMDWLENIRSNPIVYHNLRIKKAVEFSQRNYSTNINKHSTPLNHYGFKSH